MTDKKLSAPFSFYSGAVWPRNYSPLGAWVKYRPGPNKVEQIGRGPNWVHISTPDRELLLVRNASTPGAARPLNGGWDEFVSFSYTNSLSSSLSFDRYMVNYFQHTTLPKGKGKKSALPRVNFDLAANLRAEGSVIRDNKIILSDSGGFQLLTGKTEWIDPYDLAKFYRTNCDEGITLDIPINNEEEYLLRSARIQANNTKILLDNLPEHFNLFNVVHGKSDDSGRRFREIVEKDGPSRAVCIGGVYHGNLIMSMGRLIGHILDKNFKSYEQYHILGVYNVAMLIPVIRFAALMRQKGHTFCLTSDASTALYSATNRQMHIQRAHWRNAERLVLGRAAPISNPNPYRIIPCSCLVCSTLKYVDILSHVDDAIVAHSFLTHNVLEIDRWVKMMNYSAMSLNAADFSELIANQMAGSPHLRSVRMALKFIEMVVEVGYHEAMRAYEKEMSGFLSEEEIVEEAGPGLFADRNTPDKEHDDDWYKKRLNKILTRYENYHADGTTVKGEGKRQDQKRRVKKVFMNTAISQHGKRAKRKKVALIGKDGVSTHSKGGTKLSLTEKLLGFESILAKPKGPQLITALATVKQQ